MNGAREAAAQTGGHCSPPITPGSGQAAPIAVRGERMYGGTLKECVLRKADQIRVTRRRWNRGGEQTTGWKLGRVRNMQRVSLNSDEP